MGLNASGPKIKKSKTKNNEKRFLNSQPNTVNFYIRGLILGHLTPRDLFNVSMVSSANREYVKEELRKRADKILNHLRFSYYKLGEFLMGKIEPGTNRKVIIKEGFYLSDHLTQEQFVDLMGYNPSDFPNKKNHCGIRDGVASPFSLYRGIKVCPNWPVTNVNLFELKNIINILNQISENGFIFDLAFEEEMEYAIRGGSKGSSYDDHGELIYTGKYGHKDIQNYEEFQLYARVNKKLDEGPGEINQFEPFPQNDGARNLLGLTLNLTRSKWIENKNKNKSNRTVEHIRSDRLKSEGVERDWNMTHLKPGV